MQYSIVDAASVKLHFILIILDLQITIRDNLTCMQENKQAGPIVIEHCRKTLHSRTKENRLVIQIQKALWRKLEPLFSRNKKALRFKRGQRKCACIRGQILPTRNNNHSKSICVSWPLSVKHAAKITFAQWKCRTFQSIIYPAEEKILLEQAAFWYEVKVV